MDATPPPHGIVPPGLSSSSSSSASSSLFSSSFPTTAVEERRDAPLGSWLDRCRRRAVAWVRWFGFARLFGAAISVVVVLVGGWWLVRPPELPLEDSIPRAARGTHPEATVTLAPAVVPSVSAPPPAAVGPVPAGAVAAADVVVHVAGAVRHTGVVRLRGGSRVVDAVAAAGGPLDNAELDLLNLAEVLADGTRVYVPRRGELDAAGVAAPAGVATGAVRPTIVPAGPLRLNQASAAQLEALPEIGPKTAAAIVEYRRTHGPFRTVEDLGEVRGIGPATLAALRGKLVP